MHIVPRLALGAVALSLALLASGCGADEKPVASEASTAAPSVRVDPPTGKIDKAAFFRDLLAAIKTKDSVHLVVKAGDMGSGVADAIYDSQGSTVSVTGETNGRPTKLVIAGGLVYVDQGGSGKFSVIDRSDPSYGALLSSFTNIGPVESVAGIGQGTKSVTRLATRTVDGQDIAVYRLVVDPSKAAGAFKALAGTSGISESLTFTFEVDADGLLSKVTAKVAGQDSTVTLSRWGKKVQIDVPSGDEIIKPLR